MRYLVIEAHPDDLAFFCGGTIAKLRRERHEVNVLTVSDGAQGTLDPAYDQESKLAKVIRREQEKALSILGIEFFTWWGMKNHFLQPDHTLRERITRHVREIQPQAVFCFDPWNTDENPDHRAVGLAALEACSFAHMHLFHPEHLEMGLKTAVVGKMILFKSANPDTFVDISATLEAKIRAALCYESQIALMQQEGRERLTALGMSRAVFEGDFAAAVRLTLEQMAIETGKAAGLPFAEGFQVRGLGILENAKAVLGPLGI